MPRTRLHPEERRAQIIAEARRLFATRGVGATSVSDIVKAVGVAQGTFYWHFASKEEVLSAVVSDITAEVRDEIDRIARSAGLCAPEKFALVWGIWFGVIGRDAGLFVDFHREENKRTHDELSGEVIRTFVPIIARIAEQGAAEGTFATPYPADAARFVAAAFEAVHDDMFLGEGEERERRIAALWDFTLRGLGCVKPPDRPRLSVADR